jgi:beta-phosphoglucomutase-like phosphatase (HAD superfamily)
MTDPAVRPAPRIEAVIFDMDGVIVDTEPWWHEVRAAWAAGLGRTWTHADTQACMGLNSRDWSAVMRERLELEMPAEQVQDAIVSGLVARYARERVPEVPGAVAAVARIASGMPAAIASSAHREVIAAALRSVGLAGRLPVVVSSDDVPRGKPSPDVYLDAARRLAVEPAACLVIEDTYNGVRAGVAAGMTVILVPNPSFPPAPGTAELAHRVVATLAGLDPLRPFD